MEPQQQALFEPIVTWTRASCSKLGGLPKSVVHPLAPGTNGPSICTMGQHGGAQFPSWDGVRHPTETPGREPSSCTLSSALSSMPSLTRSDEPSSMPPLKLSSAPSSRPISTPSDETSPMPPLHPSAKPSLDPSSRSSLKPRDEPSSMPSLQPSSQPSSDRS
jgi:hypothetical protein